MHFLYHNVIYLFKTGSSIFAHCWSMFKLHCLAWGAAIYTYRQKTKLPNPHDNCYAEIGIHQSSHFSVSCPKSKTYRTDATLIYLPPHSDWIKWGAQVQPGLRPKIAQPLRLTLCEWYFTDPPFLVQWGWYCHRVGISWDQASLIFIVLCCYWETKYSLSTWRQILHFDPKPGKGSKE